MTGEKYQERHQSIICSRHLLDWFVHPDRLQDRSCSWLGGSDGPSIAFIVLLAKTRHLPSIQTLPVDVLQEAVAIGRTFAAMRDYQLDGNKEMVALGTMNILGSLTSCYIATGKKTHFHSRN